jgi:RNA polymerase sigma factor (sigma-70 family)
MQRKNQQKHEIKALIMPLVSRLNKVAMFLCRDKDKAEDLVAETFLKVCENFHKLKDKSKFKAWVFRILNNEFMNMHRFERKHNLVSLDGQFAHADKEVSKIEINTLDIWSPNPEAYLINKFLDEDIRKNINSLPDEFKMTVILCDIENLSYKEISAITGVPAGTVRSRLSRGRAILQKKLQRTAIEMGIRKEKKLSNVEVCSCN